MLDKAIHFSLACRGAVLICALTAQGCVSRGGAVAEQFVADSATTLSAAGTARVYARTDIRYSTSGRDYVYLGPVETNRQGLRAYFLWVATGSTLDRGFLAPGLASPASLHIVVMDELMEFELRPWQEIAPGADMTRLYPTPVEPQAEFGARVTLNQLEMLSGSAPESLSVLNTDGTTRVFYGWAEHEGWQEFIRFAGGDTELATARSGADL